MLRVINECCGEKTMNPVVHFEMPAEDRVRVKKFYEEVFGWEMTQLGEEMGNYLLATTTPTDEPGGRPKDPGAINGGFWQGKKGDVPHLVVAVDDIEEHREKFEKAGGTIIGEVMDIPGVGKFLMGKDTEDNNIGMLQPKM